jgi:hypothetical protein
MAPVKKMREVFVLHPVTEKNLSRFLKIRIILPKNALKDMLNWSKWRKSGFFGMGGIPDPP